MLKGKIKWFDNKKGYGFIIQEKNGEELFVHFSQILAMLGEERILHEGMNVEFEIVEGRKGPQATYVLRMDREEVKSTSSNYKEYEINEEKESYDDSDSGNFGNSK